MSDEQTAGPTFSVVAGNPDEEDLAVLTVTLAALRRARGNPHEPSKASAVGGWNAYWHNVRQPLQPGRDAWRSTVRR